ncbi:MAG: hypothetical protein Q8N23_25225 [Archangium sp.]|nr:hypothetical protein [Archangium sp.]MDP3156000.1 hypothetical protein [Archangium sp.]MDP3574490.1 hypothetical protein [Archangium sp.]
MGTFQTFLASKSITPKAIAITSKRIESFDETSRKLMGKRWNKRHTKETADKKYAELEIGKPTQHGRGVTEKQIAAADKDTAVTRKVRAKILKAVNTILVKKGQPAADMKVLFEGVKARVGKKPEVAAKK